MSKCHFCEYSNISQVINYDMIFDKCSKCEYIKVPLTEYERFIKSYIYNVNFLGIKTCIDINDLNSKTKKNISKLVDYLFFTTFKFDSSSEEVCNFCGDKLIILKHSMYKKFKIYYCDYCKSLYFLKSDLDEAGEYLQKYIKKRMKWYGFIFKLIEIFQ